MVGFLGEDRAHEARVAAALDISDDLDCVFVLVEDVVTGDVRFLWTQNILRVLQLPAPLSLRNIEYMGESPPIPLHRSS